LTGGNIVIPSGNIKFNATISYQVDFDIINNSAGVRNIQVGASLSGADGLTSSIAVPSGNRVGGKLKFSIPLFTDGYLWGAMEFLYNNYDPFNPSAGISAQAEQSQYARSGTMQNQTLTITPIVATDFQPGDNVQVFAGFPYVRVGK
jgi:hypothetical protein